MRRQSAADQQRCARRLGAHAPERRLSAGERMPSRRSKARLSRPAMRECRSASRHAGHCMDSQRTAHQHELRGWRRGRCVLGAGGLHSRPATLHSRAEQQPGRRHAGAVQVHAVSRGANLPEPAEQPRSYQQRHAPAESAAAGTPHHRNYARTRVDDASTDAEHIRCQGALRWGPAPPQKGCRAPCSGLRTWCSACKPCTAFTVRCY